MGRKVTILPGFPRLRPTGLVTGLPGRATAAREDCPRSLSDFRLLGHFQRVIDLNTQVAHRALELPVAEQQLHRP